jgi:hypothetical protein
MIAEFWSIFLDFSNIWKTDDSMIYILWGAETADAS